MAESHTYYLSNPKFGGGFAGDGVTQIGGTLNDYSSNQNLSEAAEIKRLLEQLSQTYPTLTNAEKLTVVAKATDEVENNPTSAGYWCYQVWRE